MKSSQKHARCRSCCNALGRVRCTGAVPRLSLLAAAGLGMTVIKRCFELLGGKIAFESKEGIGTTFVVALPLFGPPKGGNGEGTTQFLRVAISGQNLTIIP